MPNSNPQEILFAHDQWATGQLIDACAKLTEDQFHRQFEMGRGSLHDTIVHVLSATRTWTEIMAGKEPGPRMDQTSRRYSAAELLALVPTYYGELAAEAHRKPLGEMVSRTREGKTYQFTRGAVLTHVATHAMHHRAQCLNMLRHVGADSQPLSSVIEWTRAGERMG